MNDTSESPTNGQPLTQAADPSARELLADLARVIEDKEKECAALREKVAELTEDRQRLRANAMSWECEWDAEQRVFRPLLPPDFPVFTPEEIDDLRRNGVGLEDVLAYLDQLEGQ